MAFLGPIPILLATHGAIADISKIFKSCFLLHYQKIQYILCLTFFAKTLKIRIYELKFFKLQQFQYFVLSFN